MDEMNLDELIRDLPVSHHAGPLGASVSGIVEDSRRVGRGAIFIARAGQETDGRRYVEDAVERGAAAVLSDRPLETPSAVAMLVAQELSATAIALANRFHKHPDERLRLIGITGTNGKTTTAYMLRHLIGRAGRRCGMIGTVEVDDGRDARPAQLTTPMPVDLIALLGAMVRNGCDCCAMEVSSHALHQGRAAMLDFDAAMFTNLSGDHLDYHNTMEDYAAAKAMLFDSLQPDAWAVVNADDPAAQRMTRDCRARRLSFDLDGDTADCHATIHEATAEGTTFDAAGPWGTVRMHLPLIGRHNVANMLAALGAVHTLGLGVPSLADTVAQCPPIPGRLEPVLPNANPIENRKSKIENPPHPSFQVLVDYAHTDDALENVLRALRPITKGRLRVLFGCGGKRDPSKRPRMAAVACRLADDLLVTSDNPRTEDPEAIIEQIMAGVGEEDRDRVRVVLDRGEAIGKIVSDAQPGDVVLIAGKGHEDYQIVGTQRRPFDDRQTARAAIEERFSIFGFQFSVESRMPSCVQSPAANRSSKIEDRK